MPTTPSRIPRRRKTWASDQELRRIRHRAQVGADIDSVGEEQQRHDPRPMLDDVAAVSLDGGDPRKIEARSRLAVGMLSA
jgi:hypothetical protein